MEVLSEDGDRGSCHSEMHIFECTIAGTGDICKRVTNCLSEFRALVIILGTANGKCTHRDPGFEFLTPVAEQLLTQIATPESTEILVPGRKGITICPQRAVAWAASHALCCPANVPPTPCPKGTCPSLCLHFRRPIEYMHRTPF